MSEKKLKQEREGEKIFKRGITHNASHQISQFKGKDKLTCSMKNGVCCVDRNNTIPPKGAERNRITYHPLFHLG